MYYVPTNKPKLKGEGVGKSIGKGEEEGRGGKEELPASDNLEVGSLNTRFC